MNVITTTDISRILTKGLQLHLLKFNIKRFTVYALYPQMKGKHYFIEKWVYSILSS